MDGIYKTLSRCADKNYISFHMPGHKGKIPPGFNASKIFAMDTTEIPGMDNLYAPSGIIKTSQAAAAKLYGASEAVFLTNGSTAGVISAITACVKSGEKILAARNCHRSVISGIILSGANPVYLYPQNCAPGVTGSVNPPDVETLLGTNRDIRAVVIVSPTYEGIVSDIKKISEITKAAGAYLIVDGAHGAHFPFSENFPEHPLCADIVVTGLHKTLPVFGQCALLNIYNESLTLKARQALCLSQTSSPSYLFMASADYFLSNHRDIYDFEEYVKNLLSFRSRLKNLKNIKILEKGASGISDFYDGDISRLVFLYADKNGHFLSRFLHDGYGIDIEASFESHTIAISSVADSKRDLDIFAGAMESADKNWDLLKGGYDRTKSSVPEGEKVFYPPGIPDIIPGEIKKAPV